MSNSKNGSQPNGITNEPVPPSHKIFVQSPRRADVRVAMRAISLSSGHNGHGNGDGEPSHAPRAVYDTSGPYTAPDGHTDIRHGLKPLRADWIRSRGDVEELSAPSYQPPAGKNGNGNQASLERFPDAARRPVLRAKTGCNVSQMHYARKGVITPEMEYIAIRENIGREKALENGANGSGRIHAGHSFGASIPQFVTAAMRDRVVCPRRVGAGPRDYSSEHHPSRSRADDHRPQLSRQDQRQYR